ncbi:hypothetical protein IAU60_000878 [Kwoniella sp. DSM 27419]
MSAQDFELQPPNVPKDLAEELEREEGDKSVRFDRFIAQETEKYLEHLRPRAKKIEGFWLHTLLNHAQLAQTATSKEDQHALSFLEEVELVQDKNDFRPFELKFHFKENPYFSNSVLSKKFSLQDGEEPAPADGSITESMRKFEGTEDLTPSSCKIDWKSDDTNLTKKHPRVMQGGHDHKHGEACDHDDEDGFEGDLGSFFLFFENAEDLLSIGTAIRNDILPDAFAYFEGRGENSHGAEFGLDSDEEDDDDELDEEDDDDDEEIDLEAEEDNPKKRRKVGRK